MLSAADISAMQEAVAENMPDTCEIYHETSVDDGMGGQTVTETLQDTVNCYRASLRSTQRAEYADRIGERQSSRVIVPAGTIVLSGDRLSISGQSWRVLGLAQISYDIAVEAIAVLEV
jgi:hypothetical protein